MNSFLTHTLPQGMTLQCRLTRHKSTFTRGAWFELHEDASGKLLMVAKIRNGSMIIAEDFDHLESHESMAILKKKSFFGQVSVLTSMDEKELAMIQFQRHLFRDGPRGMVVVLPMPTCALSRSNSRTLISSRDGDESTLGSVLKSYVESRVVEGSSLVLQSRVPVWDSTNQCYVLPFDNRAQFKSSVKNFHLVYAEQCQEKINACRVPLANRGDCENLMDFPVPTLAQLGRVGPHIFNMDLCHPLSPLQAFAVALAQFQKS